MPCKFLHNLSNFSITHIVFRIWQSDHVSIRKIFASRKANGERHKKCRVLLAINRIDNTANLQIPK